MRVRADSALICALPHLGRIISVLDLSLTRGVMFVDVLHSIVRYRGEWVCNFAKHFAAAATESQTARRHRDQENIASRESHIVTI